MEIYGKNVVKEAIMNGEEIKKVYLTNQFKDDELISKLEKLHIPIKRISKDKMNQMVSGNHQGIVASVKDYDYSSLEELMVDNALLVILDHLEDPHNFGAIIRTCECAGVHGIIIPNRRACPVNETVIKTSAGATEHMKICMVTNINQTIDELKKLNIWVYGIELGGSDLFKSNLTGNIALVIGSEGNGISKLTKEKCDGILTMNMYGKVNSLNASVAAGISIFEVLKQRNV